MCKNAKRVVGKEGEHGHSICHNIFFSSLALEGYTQQSMLLTES